MPNMYMFMASDIQGETTFTKQFAHAIKETQETTPQFGSITNH